MFEGRVWKFGDDVDTDQIIPSQYLLLPTIEEMKQFTFEPLDPEFSRMAREGDLIVAGENFGSGSSREQAPRVLKALGVQAIIAKSFARIFFRNSINIGLPVLVSADLHADVGQGETLAVDVEKGLIKRLTNGKEYISTRLPGRVMDILSADGLIPYLKRS